MNESVQKKWNVWGTLFKTLMKWMILSVVIGGVVGAIGSGFAHAVTYVTEFREANPWVLFGLPFGGLVIVFLYKIAGQQKNTGTNRVLTVIRNKDEEMEGSVAPLILISTVITHLFGGSSGREGAALQFGASVGNLLGKWFHLNDSDRKIVIMASMSAAFSALFGTPMAASIFSMEVVSVGIMYYAALVPCVFSAFVAQYVSVLLKVRTFGHPHFVGIVPDFYSVNALKMAVLAICFALAGMLFCKMLHESEHAFKKYFESPYLRIVVGGLLVIALRYLLGTTDYLGLGEAVLDASFEEAAVFGIFFLKMVFTCLTLCSGFKGGEIVPSLFVGATLGSSLSVMMNLPPNICAACGMIGVFCSVTNCPISSMLIAFELFGFEGMPYYCVTVAICYLISGYQSLYKEQKIMYSKTENKFIDRMTD